VPTEHEIYRCVRPGCASVVIFYIVETERGSGSLHVRCRAGYEGGRVVRRYGWLVGLPTKWSCRC